MLLKMLGTFESLGDSVKMQILIKWLWGEVSESVFPKISQMLQMLLVSKTLCLRF